MTITAIIEKGADGLYSAYSEQIIGTHGLGGFGETAEKAKDDFMESIREAYEDQPDLEPEETNVDFQYSLQSFYNYFDFFNSSALARYLGINESQMRQYKNGLAFPNEKTTRKILEGIHRIARELLSASL